MHSISLVPLLTCLSFSAALSRYWEFTSHYWERNNTPRFVFCTAYYFTYNPNRYIRYSISASREDRRRNSGLPGAGDGSAYADWRRGRGSHCDHRQQHAANVQAVLVPKGHWPMEHPLPVELEIHRLELPKRPGLVSRARHCLQCTGLRPAGLENIDTYIHLYIHTYNDNYTKYAEDGHAPR